MEEKFTPHEIVWTYEKSSRIWDYYASNKAYDQSFFSQQVGDAVIDYALRYRDLRGNILDYGCGPGFLIEKLLKRGIPCEGLDFCADSVKLVEERFSREHHFKGVTLARSLPTELDSDKFDLVFFIEAIEHILPEGLSDTLEEIHRIMRKGGYVFVTTPNAENLEAAKVLCPECGCIFHRIQHVNSWNKDTLASAMRAGGFQEVMCKATRLKGEGKLAWALKIMMMGAYKLTGKKQPHLLYVGKKT